MLTKKRRVKIRGLSKLWSWRGGITMSNIKYNYSCKPFTQKEGRILQDKYNMVGFVVKDNFFYLVKFIGAYRIDLTCRGRVEFFERDFNGLRAKCLKIRLRTRKANRFFARFLL
jgi:hypothetical protein